MRLATCAVLIAASSIGPATAADLGAVDRGIRKEPAYQTKTPRYCLVAFGPDAADRVWLVQDGDALFVDRNGDGDLTDPGKRVTAWNVAGGASAGAEYQFEAGELRVGGKVHKGLSVTVTPLKRYAANPALAEIPPIRDAVKADPDAAVATISLNVQSDRFRGTGVGNRMIQTAGFYDPAGVLRFAARPADAPVVHFDGPLSVTFYGSLPALRVGRSEDFVLVVGSPGRGPGTFAALVYEDTIPKGLLPKAELTYPPADKGGPPVREQYELKYRC